jgi:hypothetical protein
MKSKQTDILNQPTNWQLWKERVAQKNVSQKKFCVHKWTCRSVVDDENEAPTPPPYLCV